MFPGAFYNFVQCEVFVYFVEIVLIFVPVN
jgi:hypothetical protein